MRKTNLFLCVSSKLRVTIVDYSKVFYHLTLATKGVQIRGPFRCDFENLSVFLIAFFTVDARFVLIRYEAFDKFASV